MMEKKDYARAVIQFANAAKAMPRNAEPHYQLALAYLATGNALDAIAQLTKAVDLNPNHREAQLKLAEVYATARPDKPREKQLLEESQQKVQTLMKSGPDSAELLDTLATTEWKLGDPAAAEKTLEQAVAKFPKHLASAVSLARVKLMHHDPAGAEAVLQTAVSQQPKSANAVLALGQLYLATNKPQQAKSQFERAVGLDPTSSPALLSLAILQTRTNHLDQAEQTYRRLSALPDPQFRGYHAAFLAAQGKRDQATAEFENLNRQYPDDRNVRAGLTREYLLSRRTADAEKLLSAALTKHANDVDALLQRAGLYLMTRRTDAAEKDLNKALHFRNDSAQAHYLMSVVYAGRGSALNQRQELGQALTLQPTFLAARLQLARALLAAGSAQASLDLLTVKEANQNSLPIIIAENWALMALKRNEDARKQVDRALAVVRAPEALLQDAYLKMEQKDYAPARVSLVEALNRSPEDLRILRLMVATYAAQNQTATGIRAVQDYARQHPASAPVQYFLAQLLIGNGQRAEARAALQSSKAANPGFTQADISLAQLDAAEGHLDQAATTLAALLAQNSQNLAARITLAAVEDLRGNRAAAVDHYKKILETQPASVPALNNLAYDLAGIDDRQDEALKYAQKAEELSPDVPAVEDTLGWVLYNKRLYSMALPHLEKAAVKDPSARHKCHLAMVYFKMGDQERGQQNLAAAIKLDPKIPEIRVAQQVFDEMHGER